jgi:hypothetical protein
MLPHIPEEQLRTLEELGSGSYGSVFRCQCELKPATPPLTLK